MNLIQRLARRLRLALAVFRDPDGGDLGRLPHPTVDPRLSEETLREQARAQGLADARRFLYDHWSFGGDEDDASVPLEPPYVLTLRHRREAAIREYRDRQALTDGRLADLRIRSGEAEHLMVSARDRMAQAAAREYQREDQALRRFIDRQPVSRETVQLPPPEDRVWEGESIPLHPGWRLAIVVFLTAVVFAIQNYVYTYYLGETAVSQPEALALALATAALTVLAPHLAGLIFRNRQATGHDRWLPRLAIALLLPSVVIIGGFGFLAARLFDRGPSADHSVGVSRSSLIGVTPATLILVFTFVLTTASVMSLMLGLARRHPFQEAYVRGRETLTSTIRFQQRLGTRINPDYRTSIDGQPVDGAAPDREAAIVHAYFSAEEAYYEGLQAGVADPTFTEAIIRRRGRRSPTPPMREPEPPEAVEDPETPPPAPDDGWREEDS